MTYTLSLRSYREHKKARKLLAELGISCQPQQVKFSFATEAEKDTAAAAIERLHRSNYNKPKPESEPRLFPCDLPDPVKPFEIKDGPNTLVIERLHTVEMLQAEAKLRFSVAAVFRLTKGMLCRSKLVPLEALLETYRRGRGDSSGQYCYGDKLLTAAKVSENLLFQSLQQGWQDKPLIQHHLYGEKDGRELLGSGTRRMAYLGEGMRHGLISPAYLVPVFDMWEEWDWFCSKLSKEHRQAIEDTLGYYEIKYLSRGCPVFFHATGVDDF